MTDGNKCQRCVCPSSRRHTVDFCAAQSLAIQPIHFYRDLRGEEINMEAPLSFLGAPFYTSGGQNYISQMKSTKS